MARGWWIAPIGLVVPLLGLGGCGGLPGIALTDRECLTRAMYFESNRSSEDGMLAVGTTVMNRYESGRYPRSICGVVGQRNQYADGVLSKPMNARLAARVERVADRVLAGERHPQVGNAMFFHTVGYSFPYTNMHYVAVAGGNAFYEKHPNARLVQMAGAAPVVETDMQPVTRVARSTAPPAPSSIDDLLERSADLDPGRQVASVNWSSADPGRY